MIKLCANVSMTIRFCALAIDGHFETSIICTACQRNCIKSDYRDIVPQTAPQIHFTKLTTSGKANGSANHLRQLDAQVPRYQRTWGPSKVSQNKKRHRADTDRTYRSGIITGASRLQIYKSMHTHELTMRIHIAVSERPMDTSSVSESGDELAFITFLHRSSFEMRFKDVYRETRDTPVREQHGDVHRSNGEDNVEPGVLDAME